MTLFWSALVQAWLLALSVFTASSAPNVSIRLVSCIEFDSPAFTYHPNEMQVRIAPAGYTMDINGHLCSYQRLEEVLRQCVKRNSLNACVLHMYVEDSSASTWASLAVGLVKLCALADSQRETYVFVHLERLLLHIPR